MYPNLFYAFKSWFGIELPFLKLVNTFGFFVALCFLVSAWLLTEELKRKQQEGLMSFKEEKFVVGAPAPVLELALQFLMGFLFGFKILGAFLIADSLTDPPAYIFSLEGNLTAGLFIGSLFSGLKWWEKHKERLAEPETRTIRIWPHDRVGDMVVYAALFGFTGAKVFHNLENWDNFVLDPIGALLSFSGLTFYGGLLCASAAILLYAHRNKVNVVHLTDAAAPSLMLGYAIGRIGCQMSGDGDWGILNSAYISGPTGELVKAAPAMFEKVLAANEAFFQHQFKGAGPLRHCEIASFWHLPDWMFGFNYPHNVIGEGVRIAGCDGLQYCSQLPISVFPTPFYETVACSLLFVFLWSIRRHITTVGNMSAIYLICNGCERFFVEKIRVNTRYEGLPFHPTQAELISFVMLLSGTCILVYNHWKKPKTTTSDNMPSI